jgi:hypothetical protein
MMMEYESQMYTTTEVKRLKIMKEKGEKNDDYD